MISVKTDEHALEKVHNEWIGSLLAYEEHLNSLNLVTRQLQSSVNDLQFQRELQQLCNEIVMQKSVLAVLVAEVETIRTTFKQRDEKQVITLADLIENNRLRERILKAEQAVFLLKIQINKFLSIAS
jgi:hypothetical protein